MTSAPLLALVIAAALAGTAAASPRVASSGELPCSPDELREALALRVGDVDVLVEAEGDAVRVAIGGRDLRVELEGARGRRAARMIAVAAADLVLPELPVEAPPAAEVRAVAAAPPRSALRLTLSAQVASEESARAAVVLGGELGGGAARLALEVGVAGGARSAHGVSLLGAPVRAGVAVGRATTIRVGAVALPYLVDGGADDTGVLLGGAIGGHGRVRVGGVDVVYLVGVDVFANQVEYRWAGEEVLTTPRVALWTGLGVAWEVPR